MKNAPDRDPVDAARNSRARDFALDALRRMMFIRAFEQKVLDLSIAQPPVVAGSVHLCAGQEAVPVGACAAMAAEDSVVATYRGHGWALESGTDPLAVMAEICHRETGINGGRAGSPYMMDPGGRFVGENSIVGAGVPIGNGIAMALRHAGEGGAVLVSFGDGAMNQGSLHEGFVFAVARKLPIVFVCENNGWSELTPTSRIVPLERLARRATAYGMPGATIDGCDPAVVRDTIAVALDRARNGDGPSLIECSTVRLWGHYNRDIEHYRPKEDRAVAEQRDPIAALRARILANGDAGPEDLDEMAEDVRREVEDLAHRAVSSPMPAPDTAATHVIGSSPVPEQAVWPGFGAAREITYQQAVNEALRAELAERPEVMVFGEDVGHAGGIFGCSRNLQKEFGENRVFDTPIAESAILGAAVGGAMAGLRPVAEIMWMDFLMVALDQLVNQAANVRYVSRGAVTAPLVVRLQQGATPGSCSQHSQSLEALIAHVPGLKVGLAATPQDAYDMLRGAVADPDPTVVIEFRSLYQSKGTVTGERTGVGKARVRRTGSDITLISWGSTANLACDAADQLERDAGLSAAVVDLRWLCPLDEETLLSLVSQTRGRALVVHEANRTGGFGAEVVARLVENGFTRVGRLGAPDVRIPASPVLQGQLLPSREAICAAAKGLAA